MSDTVCHPPVPASHRPHPRRPRRRLARLDAVAVIVGMVVGAGIYRAPSIVAGNVPDLTAFALVWIAGGVISLIGALCYAELCTSYPDCGGDYHFLHRAYGHRVSLLFAWARLSVIQTGSIAVQAFIVGDYLASLVQLDTRWSPLFAAVVIVAFTLLNITGLRMGATAQNLLTALVVLGLLLVIVAGFVAANAPGSTSATSAPTISGGGGGMSIGLAMVFVLLTYGGWNEAAYLSAEVRGGRRSMLTVFLTGIAIITALYLAATLAMVAGLGLAGVAASTAVATDLLTIAFGESGGRLIALLVVLAALSTVNASIITGARTSYAVGRDFPMFAFLGRWRTRDNVPVNALWIQGVVALALVGLGSATRDGFSTMVEYTAPVFWSFFLLAGVSLFVLRRREPDTPRPFRVPLYPLTPLLFCAACAYMLYSSIMYTQQGALVGVAVLLLGLPLTFLARPKATTPPQPAVAPA